MARQVGGVGPDLDSNEIANELLDEIKSRKGSDKVIRVVEDGKPQFQLNQGEKGLSVFDANKVGSDDILPEFREGSKITTRTLDDIKDCGLKVVCTPGDSKLPKNLQDAHLEIRPGDDMTRKQFKKAIKELEPKNDK